MASILLSIKEVCAVLNMTEEQILYLVRTRAIPHNITRDGELKFADKEVISRIIAAPPAAAMPQQKIDVDKMSTDEIMEIFAAVLQSKAAKEAGALKTAPVEAGVVAEAPGTQEPHPTKKDMEDPKTEGEIVHDLPGETVEDQEPAGEQPAKEEEPKEKKEKEPEKKEESKKEKAAKPKK